MQTQLTFEGNYCQSNAIQWLQDLGKCFEIKRATLKTYTIKRKWDKVERCKLDVRYS